MKTMPFIDRKPVFRNVKTMAEFSKMSYAERSAYMMEYDAYRTDIAAYDYAIKQGHEKGRAEGEAKGRAEGRAEGERAKAVEMAAKMKHRGYSIAIIADITGLSESEIEKI